MLALSDPSLPALLPSPAEMAAMDRLTVKNGTPSLELMERAGHGIYDALLQAISKEKELLDRTLILAGPGNNGGDGLVLARLIVEAGFRPKVVLCSSTKYSNDCRIQIQKLTWAEMDFYLYDQAAAPFIDSSVKVIGDEFLTNLISNSKIVVDSLLGTGQSGAPKGTIGKILKLLNRSREAGERHFVMSVDVPSGANADTGEVYDNAVRADLTVTIELVKRGLLQSPAREHCGKLIAVPIGLDTSSGCEVRILKASNVRKLAREHSHHKGQSGHLFVLGGSRAMPGASELCGLAALRAGAGLVTRAVLPGMGNLVPEIMTAPLGTLHSKCFVAGMAAEINSWIKKTDAFVIGPGIGTDAGTAKLLLTVIAALSEAEVPCVIDADAINIIASSPKKFSKYLSRCVLTPHPGEAARLLECDTAEIQRDRVGAARRLSSLGAPVVVLKGASTVIASQSECFVNISGNPFMATAGSGDVLAGTIGALVGQFGGCLLDAAKTGVFVHGKAGDLAHRHHAGPIIASDIINRLPFALGEL